MKIRVPEEMLMAALRAQHESCASDPMQVVGRGLHAALGWLREHPIVPTDEQMLAMGRAWEASDIDGEGYFYSIEWQRRMFQEEEPK